MKNNKTSTHLQLSGRILWLTEDANTLRKQLFGQDISCDSSDYPPLKFGINTDLMINGAACTKGYTQEILGPHFLEGLDERVPLGGIKKGGFEVIVGGRAYGSGSSREVAVTAHRGAGIRLVVAESFQRIFQENLVYAGLSHTTDLQIIDRLISRKTIDLSELSKDLPPFFRMVAEHGGLLAYGEVMLSQPSPIPYEISVPARPMTCAEKIISQNTFCGWDKTTGIMSVRPGDQVLCRTGFRGVHEYTAGMVLDLYRDAFGETPIERIDEVACFEDHFVLLDDPAVPEAVKTVRLGSARKMAQEMLDVSREYGLKVHGPGQTGAEGICHRLVLEEYAEPGSIIILTDSHTPTAGVLNAFAFGVGSTAMAFALRTGLVPVTVPKTVRVNVSGDAEGVLSPKDLILHIIGDPYFRDELWKTLPTDTCVIEFGGSGLEQWNIDELSVLTNMTVEGGMMTGILPPTEPVRTFLSTQRGTKDFLWVSPDPDAFYEHTMSINLKNVPLTVATPGDSRNRAPLDELIGTPIHNVVIASCTGGSLADLRAAMIVLSGRKLAPELRLTVTPASAQVAQEAAEEGLLAAFKDMGAIVTAPGCGSCIGNGPGIPKMGEITASTTNRNFERRMGAPGPVYLVSPAVAAASAVSGFLQDPRRI